jgi:hypothetical protein
MSVQIDSISVKRFKQLNEFQLRLPPKSGVLSPP